MAVQAREIARNSVKEKLARGEVVATMTVRVVPGEQVRDIKL